MRMFIAFLVIGAFVAHACSSQESLSQTPPPSPPKEPPFHGTIFLDPNILTEDDPTTFVGLTAEGQAEHTMFDRRVNDWITAEPYLFRAAYDDGLSIEIQVNPEFGSPEAALAEAEKYAPIFGQLPTVLRKDVETSWIHKGVNPFGGGNNNLLIHTGQSDLYERDGILEETLVHEASHSSLDAEHARAEGWKAAQAADPVFISTYARDNPEREDIAETFLLWLALRYREERLPPELVATVKQSIPNRLAYFDGGELEMYPVE